MEFKKSIIILIMAIFLASIAGVCAADANDTLVASENTSQIELSDSDKVIKDNLQTSEENTKLGVEETDETLSSKTDSEILTADQLTYSDLRVQIESGGNINLTKGTYTYNNGDGDTIQIITPGVINGNGAVIDMNNSNLQAFKVSAENVTLNNITFMNVDFDNYGGAVYFNATHGSVTNCYFKNNHAPLGSSIFFNGEYGSVINSSFVNNAASNMGGAIFAVGNYFSLINCSFIGNRAVNDGGAVYIGDRRSVVHNCNFSNNSARNGGAIYIGYGSNVTDCNFTNNNATKLGGAIYVLVLKANIHNCTFSENLAKEEGGAVYTGHGGNLSYSTFIANNANEGGALICGRDSNVENCNFFNNAAASSEYGGGAISFWSTASVRGCNFMNNSAPNFGGAISCWDSVRVNDCNFTNNHAETGSAGAIYFDGADNSVFDCSFIDNTAQSNGGAVYFSSSGNVTNCNFTDNIATSYGGAVYFMLNGNITNCNFADNKASNGGAVYLQSSAIVENCNFTHNNASNGGAIHTSPMCYGNVIRCDFTNNSAFNGGAVNMYTGIIENCNFTNNIATNAGGAVVFSEGGGFADCNFANNLATSGGAVSMFTGNVENCNFTGNNATEGSAINFNGFSGTNISNSRFLNNRANASADVPLNVTVNGNTIEITFMGQDNLLNAIYSNGDVNFTNVVYWSVSGIDNTGADSVILSPSNCEAGQNISVTGFVNGNILNTTKVTDGNGKIILENVIDYYLILRHDSDSYYTEAEKAISNMNVNVTSQTTNNRTVNITARSNIPQDIVQGKLLFILPNNINITANYTGNGTWWAVHTFDAYDVYQVNATYVGLDNVTINNGTISISKTPTNITVENTTVDLVIYDSMATGATLTPADAGNLTFTSSNSSVAKIENGKIIAVSEGTAVITVSFAGSDDFAAAENKTIAVNVVKYDSKVTISPINDTVYPNNVTIKYSVENKTNVTVTIGGVSGDRIIITNDTITVVGLDAGKYTITIINNESELYYKSSDAKSFTVNKLATSIAATDISTTYNINKDLVVTLKDGNGKALSGVKVTVDLNGAKTYTTDGNGQIKVSTKGLAPKAYTAKITFNGNTNYEKSAKNVKVTVKKATPKLTAKKKTFKSSVKTKKYTVVLKDNNGKAMKKVKVTLKIKGKKAITVKTNAKGKATFKITNLKKKGKYAAVVKYSGNKYYSAESVKVKITVK